LLPAVGVAAAYGAYKWWQGRRAGGNVDDVDVDDVGGFDGAAPMDLPPDFDRFDVSQDFDTPRMNPFRRRQGRGGAARQAFRRREGNWTQVGAFMNDEANWAPFNSAMRSRAEMGLSGGPSDAAWVQRQSRVNPAQRPLHVIAAEIRANWPRVYFGAEPCLAAMERLTSINDAYGADSAREIVLYFLASANTWRGPAAKQIKAELKSLLQGRR